MRAGLHTIVGAAAASSGCTCRRQPGVRPTHCAATHAAVRACCCCCGGQVGPAQAAAAAAAHPSGQAPPGPPPGAWRAGPRCCLARQPQPRRACAAPAWRWGWCHQAGRPGLACGRALSRAGARPRWWGRGRCMNRRPWWRLPRSPGTARRPWRRQSADYGVVPCRTGRSGAPCRTRAPSAKAVSQARPCRPPAQRVRTSAGAGTLGTWTCWLGDQGARCARTALDCVGFQVACPKRAARRPDQGRWCGTCNVLHAPHRSSPGGGHRSTGPRSGSDGPALAPCSLAVGTLGDRTDSHGGDGRACAWSQRRQTGVTSCSRRAGQRTQVRLHASKPARN